MTYYLFLITYCLLRIVSAGALWVGECNHHITYDLLLISYYLLLVTFCFRQVRCGSATAPASARANSHITGRKVRLSPHVPGVEDVTVAAVAAASLQEEKEDDDEDEEKVVVEE